MRSQAEMRLHLHTGSHIFCGTDHNNNALAREGMFLTGALTLTSQWTARMNCLGHLAFALVRYNLEVPPTLSNITLPLDSIHSL